MRKALFLSIFLSCAAPAFAADPAQCDATAFTLKKPVQAAPKVEQQQPTAKPATAQAKPKAKPKTSSRLISDCRDGKKKKTS
jgi:hypothetical protein